MPLFDLSQQALELSLIGASYRQRALAGNMANLNTPGYQRRDVDFHATLRQAMRSADPTSNWGLVRPAQALGFNQAQPAAGGAVQPDGNTVDIDQEGAMMAQNALDYQAAAQLLGLWRRNLETVMRSS